MLCLERVAKDVLQHVEDLELDQASYLFGIAIASEVCLFQQSNPDKTELTDKELNALVDKALTSIE